MKTFGIQVMSTNGIFYDGRAVSVVMPCSDGELCFMAGHEEMITAIYDGQIRITKEDGTTIEGICSPGSAQFANNRCIILVDTIELPENIDLARARSALELAKEHMRQKQSKVDYNLSKAAMARALNRLKSSKDHKI